MSYKYSIYRTKSNSGGTNQIVTYGIKVLSDDDILICEYEDISPNKEHITKLIELLGSEEIEKEQLNYIIEDYVTLIFSLE